jgi:hypothetical protein
MKTVTIKQEDLDKLISRGVNRSVAVGFIYGLIIFGPLFYEIGKRAG